MEAMVQTSNPHQDFADRLKEAMKISGYRGYGSAARLARDLEVTPKAVSKWLNGESTPAQDRMLELAKALGARVEWLMWGQDTLDDGILGEPRVLGASAEYAVGQDARVKGSNPGASARIEPRKFAVEDYGTTELHIRLNKQDGGNKGYSITPCTALENGKLTAALLDALKEDLGEFFDIATKSYLVKISLEFDEASPTQDVAD